MKFRPCIDIHNGKVKQLVGKSLKDEGNVAKENFVSEKSGEYYARLYKENNLKGGHIIILNSKDSSFYESTKQEAVKALNAYRGGMQIGGGINDENAHYFIDEGASHIIVTSYIFENKKLSFDRLNRLKNAVGKDKIVLDISCRKKDDKYYIVTDRWQTFTNSVLDINFFEALNTYCDELLIHGVDVEGGGNGMDAELVRLLCDFAMNNDYFAGKITYAGGINSYENIEKFKKESKGVLDFTIGSALDIFGGNLSFDEVTKLYG